MASASKKNKCVHPYLRTDDVWGEVGYLFTWCKDCKKVCFWHTYMKRRRIPWSWPEEIKKLAQKLSGFKIEQHPSTMIDVAFDTQDLYTTIVGVSPTTFPIQSNNNIGQIVTITGTSNGTNGSYTITNVPPPTFGGSVRERAKRAAYARMFGAKV